MTPKRTPDQGIPISDAREKLAAICTAVQDPDVRVILTRHGRAVAAVVGMNGLGRLIRQQEQEWRIRNGWIPTGLRRKRGEDRILSRGDAALQLRDVQLDRLAERRMLAEAGLTPVPGGELEVTGVEMVPARRRWWQFW
ncbi:MAG: type II toxin-antitoxin system Phd/YefM family antitoxin [Jannaschia sp.]